MLAIRLQRTGRKGHAQFRMIVQEARRSPNSGRVVTTLGNYDPHTKELSIDKDKAATYLSNGAKPSDRVARILKKEGVKLPSWVTLEENAKKAIKNPDKLRKNQPKEEAAPAEDSAEETSAEDSKPEEAANEEVPAEETPKEDATAKEQ